MLKKCFKSLSVLALSFKHTEVGEGRCDCLVASSCMVVAVANHFISFFFFFYNYCPSHRNTNVHDIGKYSTRMKPHSLCGGYVTSLVIWLGLFIHCIRPRSVQGVEWGQPLSWPAQILHDFCLFGGDDLPYKAQEDVGSYVDVICGITIHNNGLMTKYGTNRHKPAQQARPASTGTPASPGTDSQKHPIE